MIVVPLNSVYETMVARGLVASGRQFSVEWLGRSPNYIADRQAMVSVETAICLYVRLMRADQRDIASHVWKAMTSKLL